MLHSYSSRDVEQMVIPHSINGIDWYFSSEPGVRVLLISRPQFNSWWGRCGSTSWSNYRLMDSFYCDADACSEWDCNGVSPLHDNLHKVNIKYEYCGRINTIFSQYYPNRQYCLADVTHCSLVDIGSKYQPIKSSHDRSTQWVAHR